MNIKGKEVYMQIMLDVLEKLRNIWIATRVVLPQGNYPLVRKQTLSSKTSFWHVATVRLML